MDILFLFLDINHLNMIIGAKPGAGYCDACFSGKYPTKEPENTAKDRFEHKISEKQEER